MFLNFSNHTSANWSERQISEALIYGKIRDYPFPAVPSEFNEEQIEELAEKCAADIVELQPDFVMCQGEFCLAFCVAKKLMAQGIRVGAACSERITTENRDDTGQTEKTAVYRFVVCDKKAGVDRRGI